MDFTLLGGRRVGDAVGSLLRRPLLSSPREGDETRAFHFTVPVSLLAQLTRLAHIDDALDGDIRAAWTKGTSRLASCWTPPTRAARTSRA